MFRSSPDHRKQHITYPETGQFLRHDWTTYEIVAIHDLPLLEVPYRAGKSRSSAFSRCWRRPKVRVLSIKTGGRCPEDCAYCSAIPHYREVHLDKIDMMKTDAVLAAAARAKAAGADRFCMGAAWRNVRTVRGSTRYYIWCGRRSRAWNGSLRDARHVATRATSATAARSGG